MFDFKVYGWRTLPSVFSMIATIVTGTFRFELQIVHTGKSRTLPCVIVTRAFCFLFDCYVRVWLLFDCFDCCEIVTLVPRAICFAYDCYVVTYAICFVYDCYVGNSQILFSVRSLRWSLAHSVFCVIISLVTSTLCFVCDCNVGNSCILFCVWLLRW